MRIFQFSSKFPQTRANNNSHELVANVKLTKEIRDKRFSAIFVCLSLSPRRQSPLMFDKTCTKLPRCWYTGNRAGSSAHMLIHQLLQGETIVRFIISIISLQR